MRTQSCEEPDGNLYHVRGRLRLRFKNIEANTATLREAIEAAENRMPWIDGKTNAPKKSGAMFQKSDVDYPEPDEFDDPRPYAAPTMKITTYEFTLRGNLLPLEKGQLYAYEKHVEKLAEELAQTQACNLDVTGSIEITRHHCFAVEW